MNPKSVFSPLLLVLLTFSLASLASSESPWLTSDLKAQVTFSGEIDIEPADSSYSVNWIESSFYTIPQTSNLQSAELISVTPSSYTIESDSFGNKYIKFRWEKPSERKLEYQLVWDVTVHNLQNTLPDISSNIIPEEVKAFLKADNLTEWDSFIKAKAISLTASADTNLEKVRRLAEWVSYYLSYDQSCWTDSFPARKVFRDRIGVCDEFTNLFISMCRSIGIPAKYSEGLVFSGEKWNFHAWAQVYIGGWIPIDPTYNEVGFVDSSHILLASVHSDSDVYNRLSWEGSKLKVEFGTDDARVSVKDTSSKRYLDISSDYKKEVGGSEIVQVTSKLSNLANSFIVPTCSLTLNQKISLLSKTEKSVVLPPHGTASLSWSIATPDDLEEGLIYTMPMQILCFPGSKQDLNLTIDPRESKKAIPSAIVTDLTILNETNAQLIVLNNGSEAVEDLVASLCVNDSECINKTIPTLNPGDEYRLMFSGLSLFSSARVSAELHSKDIAKSKLEVQSPDLPPSPPKNQPTVNIVRPTKLASDDSIIIPIILLVLIVLIISLSIALVRRH